MELEEKESRLNFWETIKKAKVGMKKNELVRNLFPRHMKILAKIISRNRAKLQDNIQKLMRVNINLETFIYKEGLQLKLISIHSIQKVEARTQNFFKIAAKNLEGDLADLFLVSPNELNNLCKDEMINF